MKIRVRFAPSPTGALHIGGVRTALYNYLFAKQNGGKFILRIEDTDQTRFVKGAEEYIKKSLAWCGISFDEGTDEGGEHAPYRQSERKELYKKYAKQLIDSGHAYYAFDTPQELEDKRMEAEKNKQPFIYNTTLRKEMCNSLTICDKEVQRKIDAGARFVIRFKMPEEDMPVQGKDLVRGDISFQSHTLDDKILVKTDGLPTYHLANIVDDHLMKISHVIRGEEWLPSLPLHFLLYDAFGWERPRFAHLPLILKPTGKGKLSKRDGDKLGFPVFPLDWEDNNGEISAGFKENGYLPDAFVNFLAFLGWHPATDRELYSPDELIACFSLEKVQKGGARFDPDKAKWFNQQYLNNMSDEKLYRLLLPVLEEKNIHTSKEKVLQVVGLVKPRMVLLSDFWQQAAFYFIPPREYAPKVVKKRWKAQTAEQMNTITQILDTVADFSSAQTEKTVKDWITDNELSMGGVLNGLRLCLVGDAKGADLFEIVAFLGKEEVKARIANAVRELS